MSEDTNTLAARAAQLLESRQSAIAVLEEAQRAMTAAQASMEAAEKQMKSAVDTAKKAGWTTDELRLLGVSGGSVSARRSSSRRSSRRSAPAQAPATVGDGQD